jgi:hypothetical protein
MREPKKFWALHYVNGDTFIARYCERWASAPSLYSAALYETEEVAQVALQALQQEARDRLEKAAYGDFWRDIHGGLTVVVPVEVETIVRLVPQS